MFENIIIELDNLGIQYTEDYNTGSLTIDVAAMDKMALISVIQAANDSGMEFTIDEASLVVMGGAPMEEAPMEEEYPEEDAMGPMQDAALGQLF